MHFQQRPDRIPQGRRKLIAERIKFAALLYGQGNPVSHTE